MNGTHVWIDFGGNLTVRVDQVAAFAAPETPNPSPYGEWLLILTLSGGTQLTPSFPSRDRRDAALRDLKESLGLPVEVPT